MNIFSKLLCGVALLGMATGCSDHEPSMKGTVEKQGDFYARLTLSLPSTRSQTTTDGESNAGFEVGQDQENSVSSVLVVLAKKEGLNYNYVASSLTDTKGQDSVDGDPNPSTPKKPQYTVTFESEEIANFAGDQVYVFAFCNPQMNLISKINELKAERKPLNDLQGNLESDGSISSSTVIKEVDKETGDETNKLVGYFLMANHQTASVTMPSQEDLLEKYNTPSKPFNLGTIDVSRVTARFDFSGTTLEGQTVANRYPIYDTYTITTDQPKKDSEGNIIYDADGNIEYETVTEQGRTLMGYVTIDAMALMNEALNYYYLPRVSETGMKTNWDLCGSETSQNFVVSPNAEKKLGILI